MKPETILQSDLLDILFDDRNKAYGAYSLRKHYNSRLAKSVAIMSALVLSLSASWLVHAKSESANARIVSLPPTIEVRIDPLKPESPKKPLRPKAISKPKNAAQKQFTTVKIVPNEQVDKPIAKVEDLDDKQISVMDKGGDAVAGNEILPPAEGVVGGTGLGPAVIKPVVEEITRPLLTADVMPEFVGGTSAFMKFMLRNLREPDELEDGQKVVVIVKFVVGIDGTISDAVIMQSGGVYDAEVLRVVKKMPRWKPGVQNGKPVPVYFRLPVTFQGHD